MVKSYDGSEPYAFVSYAHADRHRVEAWLELLESIGCRLWFDEGLTLTSDWTDGLASKISGSSFLFLFASKNSLQSKIVNRELMHADRHGIPILPIFLDDSQLPEGLEFMLDKQVVKSSMELEDVVAHIRSDLPDELFYHEDVRLGQDAQLKRIWFVASGKAAKRRSVIAAMLLVVMAVGLVGFGLALGGRRKSPATLSVYASAIAPYTKAGAYQTTEGLPEAKDTLETINAFSLTSFLENTGDKYALVESSRLDIRELNPIEEPMILLDAGLIGGDCYLFAANNGWGATDFTIHLIAERTDTREEVPLSDLCVHSEVSNKVCLDSASVDRIAHLTFDADKFLQNAGTSEYGDAEVVLKVEGDDPTHGLTLKRSLCAVVYSEYDGFTLNWLGRGGETPAYRVTLYSQLDVPAKPESIVFTGADASPLVEDRFRVEMVIAPNRSCEALVRGVFTLDGVEQTTDEYRVQVTVPVFTDQCFLGTGPLTRELLEDPEASMARFTQIAESYRYDPDSILDPASGNTAG